MDVEIEKPHVHHRKTGIRRLDLVLPLAALFISFVSILIAWHHGEVMTQLVHQNERLVEAESLPYLQIEMSNLEADLHSPALRLTVQNQGVGPARLAEIVMTVNGRPVRDFNTLIDHCCAPGLLQSASVGSKQFRGIRSGEVILSRLRDRMIRPGEAVDAFDWPMTPANQAVLDRLRSQYATNAVNTSICYCSVFDDCWVRTDEDRRPVPVKQCPAARVPYDQ
ncbi:hypothetical protein [Sphingomonas agri]|uniref:hypothetical protein n=1 Tax=Sphingomonas agri TaxID=1813878 RepID=UPI00311DFC78